MDQTRVASPVSTTGTNNVVIHLSPRIFALTWWIIILLHAVCAIYYYYVIKLHYFLKHHDYTSYLGRAFTNYHDVVMITSGIFVGGHAISIVLPLFLSLWRRELTFDISFQRNTKRIQDKNNSKRSCFKIINVMKRVMNAWLGPQGYLSIASPQFHEIYVVREIVEIVCQTYQAYQLSSLISSVWINRVFAIGIVLNCWATVIVNMLCSWRERHRIQPQHTNMANESIRRIGYLVFDMLLNGFTSIVIPIVIIYSYVRDFNVEADDFPFLFYYNDTWFIKAVAENSQIFVRSNIDFISKALPAFAILTGLYTLRSSICRRKVASNSVRDITVPPNDFSKKLNDGDTKENAPTSQALNDHRWKWFHRISHMLLLVWGLLVLILHVYATSVAVLHKIPGCLLEIRPWFSNRYNCVVIELNCDRIQNPQYEIIDMDAILTPLTPLSVQSVIISSCPQLVMPTRITSFNRLLVLKLYNSTIYEWGTTAALEDTKHPNLEFLFMIETNMSTLPEGLLSLDFPHQLEDIEISGTNLSSLPTNLHEFWGVTDEANNLLNYLEFFIFENIYGGLTEVPSTLINPNGLQPRVISLSDTGLTDVPERFFWANSSIFWLNFAFNPLVSLPNRDPNSPMENLVLVYCDNFEQLPSWVNDTTGNALSIYLGETPICSDKNNPPSTVEDSMVNLQCSLVDRMFLFPRAYENWQRQNSLIS